MAINQKPRGDIQRPNKWRCIRLPTRARSRNYSSLMPFAPTFCRNVTTAPPARAHSGPKAETYKWSVSRPRVGSLTFFQKSSCECDKRRHFLPPPLPTHWKKSLRVLLFNSVYDAQLNSKFKIRSVLVCCFWPCVCALAAHANQTKSFHFARGQTLNGRASEVGTLTKFEI